MSNVPFAIELREKFGLTQETSDEQMAEYLELSIQRLKGHLIDMASIKMVEFFHLLQETSIRHFCK